MKGKGKNMNFKRFEIRTYHFDYDKGRFVYEGEDFEYIDFKSLVEAWEYAEEHNLHSSNEVEYYICKVTLYPNSDFCDRILRIE